MRREIATQELQWIDVWDPSADDLEYLRTDLGFHALDVAECQKFTALPKVEIRPSCLFLVLHVPQYLETERTTVPVEFDVFVSSRAIVTVHAGSVASLERLFQEVAEHEELRERTLGRGTAYVLYSILDHLFEAAFPMLTHIAEKLTEAEGRIFAGEERQMVTELSVIQRDLNGFRSVVRPQRHFYEVSVLQGEWATPAFRVVFGGLHGKLSRLWEYLEVLQERADALTATNAALLNYKLNEFVKVLTVLSALFIPLGLVAQTAVFINADVPSWNRLVFWFLIACMLLVDYVIIWKARRRKIL